MALSHQIDNYPGFEEGVDGFTLGMKMQSSAERFGAKTLFGDVHSAKLDGAVKELITDSGTLYAKTVGLKSFDIEPLRRSIELIMTSGTDYEFRTTVVKGLHTEESLTDAARWISGAKEYYLQQYKDSGNVLKAEGLASFSDEEMKALRDSVAAVLPVVSLRGV